MNYTEAQLKILSESFKRVHEKLEQVFKTIAENDNLALNAIDKHVGIGVFIRDKCVAALEFAGLVEREESGTAKKVRLTKEGKRMKVLLDNKK